MDKTDLLKNVVEAINFPSILIRNGVVHYFNPTFSLLIPNYLSDSEFTNKSIEYLKPIFSNDTQTETLLEKINNQEPIHYFPVKLWNNSIFWVSSAYFGDDKSIYALIFFNRIPPPTEIEFPFVIGTIDSIKSLFDNLNTNIAVFNENNALELCNQSFANLFGKTEQELIGLNFKDIFDEEIAKVCLEDHRKLLQGEVKSIHHHLKIKDFRGKEHFLELTKSLVTLNDKKFIFCQAIDSSQLDFLRQLYEESSTLFRALIENAFDAIYLMKGRRYQYVNPRFCEITGYTAEELTSDDFDFSVLIPEESKKILEERYQARLEGREIPNQYELQLLTKTRNRVFVEVSTVSVGLPGEVVVMGIMRDITQRKKYEEQLRESERKLRELNEAKDKFFNIIAHDLRSPISGLISMTKTLIENKDVFSEEEKNQFLEDLLKYANQSYNLLENLLQWARSQTGTIPFYPQVIDLYEVSLASKVLSDPAAAQKSIQINLNVQPNSFVEADLNMITSIVRNFISNAIKFTNSGGRIDINIFENGDNYELQVVDNGVGMSPEQLSKLFRIGEEISTLGTGGEKGSGLGLILCKEFAEKNKGSIKIESQQGVGTTCTLILPKLNKSDG